jgi:hypothetical protein
LHTALSTRLRHLDHSATNGPLCPSHVLFSVRMAPFFLCIWIMTAKCQLQCHFCRMDAPDATYWVWFPGTRSSGWILHKCAGCTPNKCATPLDAFTSKTRWTSIFILIIYKMSPRRGAILKIVQKCADWLINYLILLPI